MAELTKMADRIYDLAGAGGLREVRSSAILTDYLEKRDFRSSVDRGSSDRFPCCLMNRETEDLPFGFLAEYDALKGIGHACGHHMQGPSVIGAALALRDLL